MRYKQPIWSSVLLSAWFVWLADVGSKTWALIYLEGREPVKIIGTFLQLALTKNSGAAFSFATNGTVFLTTFGLLVVVLIGFWTRRITSRPWAIALGLVLGGTLGNLTDRTFRSGHGAFRGEVIDWIALPHWPTFNVADSAIVIAAVVAMILSFRNIAPISPKSKEGPNGA
ncbi:MAG: signal peptidase II [Actinomycetota bacterium]